MNLYMKRDKFVHFILKISLCPIPKWSPDFQRLHPLGLGQKNLKIDYIFAQIYPFLSVPMRYPEEQNSIYNLFHVSVV